MDRALGHLRSFPDQLIAERRLAAHKAAIHLANRIAPNAALVADPVLLRRSLENIVENALRHTPSDGRIEFASAPTREAVELRIGNSGPVIPEPDRARIFDKFFQGRRPGRSNFGLGLYFCRLVADAHGGRIWVESAPTLPTVFVMSFPVVDLAGP